MTPPKKCMQDNCEKLIKWNILLDKTWLARKILFRPSKRCDKEKSINNKTSRSDIDFYGVGSRKVVEKTQVVSFPGEMKE